MKLVVALAVASMVAACSTGGGLRGQIAHAAEQARIQDELLEARFAAENLVRPSWLEAPPVGVAPLDWRAVATTSLAEQGEALELRGLRAQRVRLVNVGAGAESLGGALVLAGFEVGVEVAALEAVASHPMATVRLVAAEPEADYALTVTIDAPRQGLAGAAAIVARTVAYDTGLVVRANGVEADAAWDCAFAPTRWGGAEHIAIELHHRADASDAARSVAVRIAAALADARAFELERYLLALDAEYQLRLRGEVESWSGAPSELSPQEWHRDVRTALRGLCLALDGKLPQLERPPAAG